MVTRTFELRNPGASDGLVLTTDGSVVSFSLMSTGAEIVTLASASGAAAAIAALTEDGGAIGGTSDGDIPDLAATAAALTEASGAVGGTNDGDLPDLSSPDAAANAAAVREVAVMLNAAIVDIAASVEASQELATHVNTILAALETAGIIAT